MLLKVGIDPEAPEDLGGTGPGPLVLRYLRERCVLVTESPAARAALMRRFRDAPGELQQAMSLLLSTPSRCIDRPGGLPIDMITQPADLTSWAGGVHLLLLAQYRAEALAEAGNPLDPECSSFHDAANTHAFDDVSSRWERHAPVGASRDALWTEVFLPIANHTGSIYITDRYAAKSLADSLSRSGRAKHQTGPEWFLSRAARSKVRTVHLASSERELRAAHHDPQSAGDAIRRWFDAMGTGTRLDLHLVDGNFKHGRTVLFDGWLGFELHNGLESFSTPALTEAVDLNGSVSLGMHGRSEFGRLVAGR